MSGATLTTQAAEPAVLDGDARVAVKLLFRELDQGRKACRRGRPTVGWLPVGSSFCCRDPIQVWRMNKRGNPKSLVASHPRNLNAAKQGVHSPRLIQVRAAEIATELTQAFEFSPAERLAVHEAARCISILEAIDRDLDQRGLVDTEGKPRYLLNHRSRTSRQLEQWLEKISAAIERQADPEQTPVRADFPDYVRALQRIALGHDPTGTARDRLAALKELLELGARGTTSYLERPAQDELMERANATREAHERRQLEQRERELGITQ
jgi:hypothetical protein